ncbi:MAG: glycosyltransferase family 2 protein [Eubacteriales bacterium]|nr:glycosyltransferase family 2 protein [Eubacteriales bacterium]
MLSDPKFTVVIPNYNGLKFMENCMAALRRQSYNSFVVLNVDNGSSDGSREYLEELEKTETGLKIKNIFLDSNTGFSGAVNTGIAASDTEYVILLNNDTEADPDYIKKIAEAFEADKEKKLFAVSPKMIQLYHKDLLDDAGDGYNLLGWAFQRGVGQKTETKKFEKRTNVFSACAGAAGYRRSVLEEIKLSEKDAYFDPLHFAYLEDLDISFRARIFGYDIVYLPDSVVYHVGSGTSGSKYNKFKVRLAARNNVYLNYKNMPFLMLLLNLPGILCGAVIKLLFFAKLGFGKDYASGFAEGIRTLPECGKHKTAFRLSRLFNYIKIEIMLIGDTFSYIQDFLIRHI